MNTDIKDIDGYIATFPEAVQLKLQAIREAIGKAAPDAEEAIKYAMPTFVLNGNLVHFAGYKKHIGFYPAPAGIVAFDAELAGYKCSKGAIQFPLDRPIPLVLVQKIVKFRAAQNLGKAMFKKEKAPSKKQTKE